ncbi:potassium voltage-gated channel subfamily A member 1-like [Branchiostoma floridae x Branchiostoma belcheri]
MEAALISTMDVTGGDQKGSPWAQPRMARPREAPPRWSDFQRDLTEERRRAEYDHRRRRIVINVSGLRLETQPDTLARFPDTLLGDPGRRRQYYDAERREYFFDRHRPSAEAILAFYQTGGKLHRPSEVPLDVFTDELRFFELGDDVIANFRRKEGFGAASSQSLASSACCSKLWLFLEFPKSSLWAKVYAVLCVGFILLSISSLCLETLPSFSERVQDPEVEFTTEFFWIETVCVAWFTLEVVLRFVACPRKKDYFRSVLNVFDVLAIVPYFITVSVVLASDWETSGLYRKASLTLRLMRLVRVLRIFKLSRYSEGLKMMGSTLAGSGSDIGMLLVFMVILVILFASAIYFVEQLQPEDSESHFSSIPDAFWWAIVTMVTLGYGDTYPQTGAGKFVGSLCALAGILTISLPVPVIVTQFDRLYNQKMEKDWEERGRTDATTDDDEEVD